MSTPQTPKTPTPRTRGRKPLLAPPMGIESIEAAEALASNPKALELSSQIAAQKRTIERLTSERTKLTEELAEAKATETKCRDRIEELNLQHAADLKERLALANQRDEARAERDDYKRSVDALTTQLDNALAERNAAQQGAERLQVERDQWKATAERFQASTNNLGGMLKAQGRDEEYHGIEADLPGGLLSSLPNPFRWLLRWIGGAK